MAWTVGDIINMVEDLAPRELAASWDNVGLQVGARDWPVKSVWVALDPLPQVISAACREDVDLLITHHPLIFKPLTSIDCATPTGNTISSALNHHLAIFSAHTNLDAAVDGVNDCLARCIDLRNLGVLQQGEAAVPDKDGQGQSIVQGLGRTGDLARETTLASLARDVRESLGLGSVAIAGNPELPVDRVALCSGSGASMLGDFLASDAQVYISGDLRYHDARDVEAAGRGLIDVGHFASEHLIVDVLTGKLIDMLKGQHTEVAVTACRLEKDPFKTI